MTTRLGAARLLFLRLFTGGIFLYAPLDKILHPGGFSDSVWNYHLLPQAMVNLWSLWLPWLELVASLAILAGVWSFEAALVVNVLYVLFLIAIGQGLARGINFECGCFSQGGHGASASWQTIGRDLSFFAMSMWLLFSEQRQNSWALFHKMFFRKS